MSHWNRFNLGDITTWRSGGTPPKMDKKYWNGTIPWISAKTLTTRKISNSEILITQEGLEKGSRLAKIDSILLLVRGSGLYNDIPISIVESPVAFNQDIKSIEADKSIIHPYYLLYWLIGNKDLLNTKLESTGIGAGKFDTNQLQNLEVELPSLKEQEGILSIARCWDDKIELNRQMNHTLEQMAQALFKKYFVEDVDSENLPEGWRMGKLKDAIKKANTGGDAIKRAPIVDYETEWRCARVGDLANKRPYQEWGFCEVTNSVFENFRLRKNDIIVTRTAILGINAIIPEDLSAVFNNGLIRIRMNEDFNPLYVYQAMQSDNYSIYIDRASGDSSTRPNMQINYLLDYPLLKPSLETQNKFCLLLESLLSKKNQNEIEIYNLINLRDTLLPKLMSGEVNVEQVPATA